MSAVVSLKDRTSEIHRAVETALTERFLDGPSFDVEDLQQILAAFFGLYAPLDASLSGRVHALMDGFDYICRSERLERDLQTLGLSDARIDSLPTLSASAVVSPETLPELLGCLYVIEGSSLGNRVLRRRIGAWMGEEELPADAFFHDDTRQTRERWAHFSDRLDRHVTDRAALDAATRMARSTFQMFEEWFS